MFACVVSLSTPPFVGTGVAVGLSTGRTVGSDGGSVGVGVISAGTVVASTVASTSTMGLGVGITGDGVEPLGVGGRSVGSAVGGGLEVGVGLAGSTVGLTDVAVGSISCPGSEQPAKTRARIAETANAARAASSSLGTGANRRSGWRWAWRGTVSPRDLSYYEAI